MAGEVGQQHHILTWFSYICDKHNILFWLMLYTKAAYFQRFASFSKVTHRPGITDKPHRRPANDSALYHATNSKVTAKLTNHYRQLIGWHLTDWRAIFDRWQRTILTNDSAPHWQMTAREVWLDGVRVGVGRCESSVILPSPSYLLSNSCWATLMRTNIFTLENNFVMSGVVMIPFLPRLCCLISSTVFDRELQ